MSETIYNFALPYIGTVSLTASNIIEIFGIVISLFTSIVAIVISVKTLKQNSQMIEESSRPYITMYIGTTYFSSPIVYLVMKNFGSSSAEITNFNCSVDLSEYAYDTNRIPFAHILGTHLAPGQTLSFPIKVIGISRDVEPFIFEIEYKTFSKVYSETISLNFAANLDIIHMRANTKDQHMKEISFALQDIAEKML